MREVLVGLSLLVVALATGTVAAHDPAAPFDAHKVAVEGRYAYLADRGAYAGALRIVDVADAAAPRQVSVVTQLATPGAWSAVEVAAASQHVYVAVTNGLTVHVPIVSVADPTTPRRVNSTIQYRVYDIGFVVDAGRLLLTNVWQWSTLGRYDLADPADPSDRGFSYVSNIGCSAVRPAVAGRYAYVADCLDDGTRRTPGLAVVDLDALHGAPSNGAQPVGRLWFESPDGSCPCVTAAGAANAYVAVGSTLRVVDVRDPTQPRQLSSLARPGGTWHEARVVGDRLYAATAEGLVILSLADPAQPMPLGRYPTAAAATDVAVDGSRAYLAAGREGLLIVDVADAGAPRLLGAFTQPPHNHVYLPVLPQRAAVG